MGALVVLGAAMPAGAQMVRLSQREVTPPDHATFHTGPLYSTVTWTETVGYRYTTSSGSGTDYLVSNDRGTIDEDGSEFPILSSLTFRNYVVLTRNVDLDASVRVGYDYYPLGTQEDEFYVSLADEGVYGTLSSRFRLSSAVDGGLYDTFVYKTDYVDTRGLSDKYGGSDYTYFANTVGGQLDWRLAKDKTLGFDLSRQDWWPQDDEFDDQERTVHEFVARYTQPVLPGFDGGVVGTWSWQDYKLATRNDTWIEQYDAFIKGDLTERSKLNASVGHVAGHSTGSDTNEDYTAISASAGLQTQLRKDTSHRLSYTRGLRAGFHEDFEEYDQTSYSIRWTGVRWSAHGSASLLTSEPAGDETSGYRDWVYGAGVSHLLTRRVTVTLTSTYSVRENTNVDVLTEEEQAADPENANDYETWVTRLSTGFQLTKHVTFDTYAEHAERFSDSEDLAYSRDTFAAYLSYQHQF